MNINALPQEVLVNILYYATRANEAEGERYTYGLTQAPLPLQNPKLTKYVRGPLSAESLRWDANRAIRQVCSRWHAWALSYNLEHVFERRWRGSERWAELTLRRPSYSIYELIDKPSGLAVYRDPFGSLKQTARLFESIPSTANHVRRLWFNGFYTAETDKLILSIIAHCNELAYLSVPWTVLRRGTPEDWYDLLNVGTGHGQPLHSLELQAVCLPHDQAQALQDDNSANALGDARIDFSALERLKIFGNTLHKPITDDDLALIARTATNLRCLDLTNLSTVSVAGMLALVKASASTLQVLEHSPRSDDGFYHPYPGNHSSGSSDKDEHICTLLAALPQMRDLSISIPYMCAQLFANQDVKWAGDCQVRAIDLCGCSAGSTTSTTRAAKLRDVLASARALIAARSRVHVELRIELFFAGCIFRPGDVLVHGDLALVEIASRGRWPRSKQPSTLGPYGSSGTYGKEEGFWDAVGEDEYLDAVERGWTLL